MKETHKLQFKSGKEIELSEEDYQELKELFGTKVEVKYIPTPSTNPGYYPPYNTPYSDHLVRPYNPNWATTAPLAPEPNSTWTIGINGASSCTTAPSDSTCMCNTGGNNDR